MITRQEKNPFTIVLLVAIAISIIFDQKTTALQCYLCDSCSVSYNLVTCGSNSLRCVTYSGLNAGLSTVSRRCGSNSTVNSCLEIPSLTLQPLASPLTQVSACSCNSDGCNGQTILPIAPANQELFPATLGLTFPNTAAIPLPTAPIAGFPAITPSQQTQAVAAGTTPPVGKGDNGGGGGQQQASTSPFPAPTRVILTGAITSAITGAITGAITVAVTGSINNGGITGGITGGTTGGVTGGVNIAITGGVTGGITGDVTDGIKGGITNGITAGVPGSITGDITGGITGDSTNGITNGFTNGLATPGLSSWATKGLAVTDAATNGLGGGPATANGLTAGPTGGITTGITTTGIVVTVVLGGPTNGPTAGLSTTNTPAPVTGQVLALVAQQSGNGAVATSRNDIILMLLLLALSFVLLVEQLESVTY